MLEEFILAELDFRQVTNNCSVQAQGLITCLYTPKKGWFWIEEGKFPSRQDLALVTNRRVCKLIGDKK